MIKDEYRKIEVVPYNIQWKSNFNKEAALIKDMMKELIVDIHHIGSTAIAGIKAKPIIDMIPEVIDISMVDKFNEQMKNIGYTPYGEYGLVGRRFFVKFDQANVRLVNAHFYQTNNPEIEQHLLFLKHMNSNQVDALKYSELKEELTKKFPNDIDAYCNGKDLFVKNIINKCGFGGLYLRQAFTDNEWHHYHRIVKSEIFNRNSTMEYDPNHPSIKNSNNKLYVFYKGVEIIGTLMIEHHTVDIAIIRIIAIDRRLQKQGYGKELIKHAENVIKTSSYKKILLHANPEAYDFYINNGYSKMDFSFDISTFKDSIDMGKILK
jgi:GrpB-like predicted nucleotidyltransferase (UPF0157 family)/ribosomal protein S18 acetylase RimI-like enzyme